MKKENIKVPIRRLNREPGVVEVIERPPTQEEEYRRELQENADAYWAEIEPARKIRDKAFDKHNKIMTKAMAPYEKALHNTIAKAKAKFARRLRRIRKKYGKDK